MTKSISFVSFVAAATAASANRHPPPIADHDDRAERFGLRGLGGWQKVPGRASLSKGRGYNAPEPNIKGIEDPRVKGIEKKNDGREKRVEKMRRPNKGGPTQWPVPPPAPVDDFAIHGFPTYAPDEATEPPTSASPTTDTLVITTSPPTGAPTSAPSGPTPTPTDSLETVGLATTPNETPEADVVIASNALVPPCPPYYSTSSSYVAGDTIEVESNVFECRPPPYEAYCSIAQLDEGWDGIEKSLWDNAWTHVNACGTPTTAAPVVRTDATTTAALLTSTVATTSASATNAAKTTTATVASTPTIPVTTTVAPAANTEAPVLSLSANRPEIPSLPPCPDAYDLAKTTYVVGEVATVKRHIFKCSDETYCNIATWDDALLAQDADAKDKWDTAWEAIGECMPTQMELMEEEAEYDS
ncbi:hypothetical protein ACHAXT_011653 [Thalassiosira profunda]